MGVLENKLQKYGIYFFKYYYYDLHIQPSPVLIFFLKSSVILKMLTCENGGIIFKIKTSFLNQPVFFNFPLKLQLMHFLIDITYLPLKPNT